MFKCSLAVMFPHVAKLKVLGNRISSTQLLYCSQSPLGVTIWKKRERAATDYTPEIILAYFFYCQHGNLTCDALMLGKKKEYLQKMNKENNTVDSA